LQLLRARLHLLEQPRVLDGDYGLLGKDFEQLGLSPGERANLCSPEGDNADGLSCAKQWDGEYRAMSQLACAHATLGIFVAHGLQVWDLDDLPLEYSAPTHNRAGQGQSCPADRAACGNRAMVCNKAKVSGDQLMDGPIIGVA
jgi:hypothetical protein